MAKVSCSVINQFLNITIMEKDFVLNENGVCINPNIIKGSVDRLKWSIETAIIDGRWYYGYNYFTPISGGGCGVSKVRRDSFDTEQEAISYAAKRIMYYFSSQITGCKKQNILNKVLAELKNYYRPQPRQLSLFDQF